MQLGLYAEYEKIRIWSSSTFVYDRFVCPPGGGVGGAGVYFSHHIGSGNAVNIMDFSAGPLSYFGFLFMIELSYEDAEPTTPRHSIDVNAYLFGNPIWGYHDNSRLHAEPGEPEPDIPFPSYINMEFILKKPRIYFGYDYASGRIYTKLIADGYKLVVLSDVSGLSADIDVDTFISASKLTTNPAEIIFIGSGFCGKNLTNPIMKAIGCNIPRINPSSTLVFGGQYMMKGESVYKSLPITIDVKYPSFPHPYVSGSDTGYVEIRTKGWLEFGDWVNIYHSESLAIALHPNRTRSFRRILSDITGNDNLLICYRGAHPRVKHFEDESIIVNGEERGRGKVSTYVHDLAGLLLTILEGNRSWVEDEVFDYNYICPYYMKVIDYNTDVYNAVYYSFLMAENTSLYATQFSLPDADGDSHYDQNNPIFAHLANIPFHYRSVWMTLHWLQFVIINGSLILNTYSLWNWILYFPPDEDENHWKLGVPLQKVNSSDYWFPIREQYIYHSRLPAVWNIRKRNFVKDTVCTNSVISSVLLEHTNSIAGYYNYGGLGQLFTPLVPMSFLGLCKPKKLTINTIPSRINTNALQYNIISGGAGVPGVNGITITPTSNTVVLEYDVGNWDGGIYLYDVIANRFKYELVGSNITNVRIVFVSFSGDEKEVYSGGSLSGFIDKVLENDIKFSSSSVVGYSGNLSLDLDRGFDVHPDGISSSVFSNAEKVVNYSLLCSNNIDKIRFEISLSSLNEFQFRYLEFYLDSGSYYHIIEGSNIDVLARNNSYMRYGHFDFLDWGNLEIKTVPDIRDADYRMNAVDGCCFIRNVLYGADKSMEIITNYIESMYDMFEIYPYWFDFFTGEVIFDKTDKAKNAINDTFMFPFGDGRRTGTDRIDFIYGNYLAWFPPISTVPQYCFGSNNLNEEYVYLYCPYKRFMWNYKRRIELFRKEYDDSENETNSEQISYNANEYGNTGDIVIRRYDHIVDNTEVIMDWLGNVINSPRFIISDVQDTDEIKLSRITPFHGHTVNEMLRDIVITARKRIYRGWVDDNFAGKIYLLGRDFDNNKYLYGFYNHKTGEINLNETIERSQDFTLLANNIYLEFANYDESHGSQKKFIYRVILNGEEIGVIRIGGRRPSIVFHDNILYVGSRDDILGGYYIQSFIIKSGEIVDNAQLVGYDGADIDNLEGCIQLGVLDKKDGLFIYANHYRYGSNKDIAIKYFNSDGILPNEDYAWIFFSEKFGTDKSYSFPYITHYDNYVIVSGYGSDNKIYYIVLFENKKDIITGSISLGENITLAEYFHPIVAHHISFLFANINDENRSILIFPIDEISGRIL
jgi:hypothetical protein